VTGIPAYMTEQDLREHFEDFGHIVEMQLTEAPANHKRKDGEESVEGEKKRVFLECLIQYHTAANARKCYTSTRSVRDNRHIQIRPAFFNIIPPADVPYPGDEIAERDAAIVAGTYVSNKNPAGDTGGRKKSYAAVAGGAAFHPGANKYRRGNDDANIPAHQSAGDSGSSSAEGDMGMQQGQGAVAPAPALTQEKYEAKKRFEELKELRQQAEEIAKKKEAILLVSCMTFPTGADDQDSTPTSASFDNRCLLYH
jgi:RNA recognition motif-containing protein